MASASAGIAEDLFLLHRSGQVVQPLASVSCAKISGVGGKNSDSVTRSSTISSREVALSIQTASRWYGLYSNGRATRSVYQPASILGNSYLPSRSLYTVVRIAFL